MKKEIKPADLKAGQYVSFDYYDNTFTAMITDDGGAFDYAVTVCSGSAGDSTTVHKRNGNLRNTEYISGSLRMADQKEIRRYRAMLDAMEIDEPLSVDMDQVTMVDNDNDNDNEDGTPTIQEVNTQMCDLADTIRLVENDIKRQTDRCSQLETNATALTKTLATYQSQQKELRGQLGALYMSDDFNADNAKKLNDTLASCDKTIAKAQKKLEKTNDEIEATHTYIDKQRVHLDEINNRKRELVRKIEELSTPTSHAVPTSHVSFDKSQHSTTTELSYNETSAIAATERIFPALAFIRGKANKVRPLGMPVVRDSSKTEWTEELLHMEYLKVMYDVRKYYDHVTIVSPEYQQTIYESCEQYGHGSRMAEPFNATCKNSVTAGVIIMPAGDDGENDIYIYSVANDMSPRWRMVWLHGNDYRCSVNYADNGRFSLKSTRVTIPENECYDGESSTLAVVCENMARLLSTVLKDEQMEQQIIQGDLKLDILHASEEVVSPDSEWCDILLRDSVWLHSVIFDKKLPDTFIRYRRKNKQLIRTIYSK